MDKEYVEPLLSAEYEGFVRLMNEFDNVVDAYVEAEDVVNDEVDGCREKKRELDADIKYFKTARERLRGNLLRYIQEKGVERLDGVKAKSVTFQPEKVEVKTEVKRQIKVGRQYQDLDSLSKDDLVEMLESKGVKTRELVSEEEIVKPASIRVLR